MKRNRSLPLSSKEAFTISGVWMESSRYPILVRTRYLHFMFQTAVIFPLHNKMAGLSKAPRVFEDKNMNLVHIESRLAKERS